jgi:hypothetical protein
MAKKPLLEENETYVLPSDNAEMEKFISTFRQDMMWHTVKSIEYALKNKLAVVELFSFKSSNFIVTLHEKEFDANLAHIYEYYQQSKLFEFCPKIEELRKKLKHKI